MSFEDPSNSGNIENESSARDFVRRTFSSESIADRSGEKPEDIDVFDRETPKRPVLWHELFAVSAAVVLADVTLFHGEGFAGIATFLSGFAALICLGVAIPRSSGKAILFAILTTLVSVKLLWCGFVETAIAGFVVLFLFGMIQTGHRLRLPNVAEYFFQILFGGQGLEDYKNHLVRRCGRMPAGAWFSVGLPVAALVVFGTIFVMANPSLVEMIQRWFQDIGDRLSRFTEYLPSWFEIVFWIAAAWIATGMIRPQEGLLQKIREFFGLPLNDNVPPSTEAGELPPIAKLPYYAGCRNMLVSVIALFAVYLAFEFKTLWFRTFPEGFCYSDYSHRGAAWLVVALALSTAVLSLVFRPAMFRDPRIGTLKTLAWCWSALNFVLALGIYNRLFLYINFNGMTRMRVVGLLGMTAVLIGFVMVVRKIAERRDFAWLIRRFVWTVLAMTLIDLVLPVDWLVHHYNVRRILHGDPAPAVQLSVHPCSNEGYLNFLRLAVGTNDELIRDGIQAKLAQKYRQLNVERHVSPEGKYRWTKFQIADELLLVQLRDNRALFEQRFENVTQENEAINRFDDYVYRWY